MDKPIQGRLAPLPFAGTLITSRTTCYRASRATPTSKLPGKGEVFVGRSASSRRSAVRLRFLHKTEPLVCQGSVISKIEKSSSWVGSARIRHRSMPGSVASPSEERFSDSGEPLLAQDRQTPLVPVMAGNQSVGDQEMQQRTLNIAIAANAGLGLLLSGIVIGSVASSANAESTSTPSTRAGGTITACVNKNSKAMRLTSSCSKNETKVSWNAQGSTGPMGLQGSTGPQGPQGAQG